MSKYVVSVNVIMCGDIALKAKKRENAIKNAEDRLFRQYDLINFKQLEVMVGKVELKQNS